ncbi:ABC transporter substrate-binding protein [Gryllotalpicola ginsengisoli]|uniref:ABC transporter substrate-binding protein n=1 Tax=Gryllotalpicola ginsengisoli TaxID=444608 RepID=UPI0003B62EC9|nr:sugar ABC transporter substrate-binding protein [Gryllotalpicola ginsengisoli]
MPRLRALVATAALLAAAGALLTGCSPASSGATTLTFRTWDENAAKAYRQSFAALHKKDPDLTVKVDVVPWADYFTKLRTDLAGGSADDLFWMNAQNYSEYAKNGALVDVDKALGTSAKKAWAPQVVDQFTQDGTLWGVPQTSDGGIAVYYNKELVQQAGLTEADIAKLTWSPDHGADDTLLKVAQKLTKDSNGKTADQPGFDADKTVQWGYSAAQDLQAIYLPFIGSNGGTFQKSDGTFTFTDPKTEQAFQYLVDLINEFHVAPSAADTNSDGDFTLNQFQQGKIALFQSGLYNLSNVADNVKFSWGVVSLPAGPAGAVSVTNGVSVVGNAKSTHQKQVAEVLKWLGSEKGNAYIGSSGANLPAVLDAQQVYFDHWKKAGVDVSPFFDVIDDKPTIPAPVGAHFSDASTAFKPYLDEVFLGRTSVKKGLEQAQKAANKAVTGGD